MPKPLAILVVALMSVLAGVGTCEAQAASGQQFRSADEARAWLKSKGISPTAGSMLAFLMGDDPSSADVMRAYVALGFPVNGPGGDELSPLTLVTRSCVDNPMAAATTAVLIAAGADPTLKAPDGNKETPLMEAVNCPAVLKAMLATRPNRSSGEATPSSRSAGTIDWESAGPFPARSKTEAAKLLSRPGADTSVQDHFWDGIRRQQPQRLALALQAGADVRGLSSTKSTPLIELAERCRGGKPALLQSLTDQLIAAKADPMGVDEIGRTALVEGAPTCPIEILRAFITAGVPLNVVGKGGDTAMRRAINAGRVDVVNLLIDSGVDPRKEPYNANREAAGNKAMQDALRRPPK